MTPDKREKQIFEYIANGDWDRAIEHAKAMPMNWDIWQRMPSATQQGMPNHAINKVLDYLDDDALKHSGFLYELATSLHDHHDTPTVNRLAHTANTALDGSHYETKAFISHPSYKLNPDEQALVHVHEFWKNYEKKVHPSHFAVVKSLYTGQPETVKHREQVGSSHADDPALPHMRDYAQKIQDKILADDGIRKRYYNGQPYIKVHRGIGGHYARSIREAAGYEQNSGEYDHKNLAIPVAPFSSWTTDLDMAQAFAKGRGADLDMKGHGAVLSKWMPVKDILHSGAHNVIPGRYGVHPQEQEMVFGHPTGKMKINTGEMQFETLSPDYNSSSFSEGKKRKKVSKGVKEKALSLATAAAMLGAPQQLATQQMQMQPVQNQQQVEQPLPGLKYIEMIESSGGKNMNHKMVRYGLNAGTKAIGRYGLMPMQVLDTIKYDKNLATEYPKFLSYNHKKDAKTIADALKTNKDLENKVANSHWKRLHDRFDGNEHKMAYAWLNGITGTLKSNRDAIHGSDYVKKYNRYKKMMDLEQKPIPLGLKKSEEELPADIKGIKLFEPIKTVNPDDIEKVKYINQLIENRAFHKVPGIGQFTSGSFVLGNTNDDAWLIKVESGSRPAIISAKSGVQAIKEVAFYELAKKVFNLGNFIPDAILGEVETQNERKPAAAIKMLDDSFSLSVDKEQKKPGTMMQILEKYRKSGILHKMAFMLYVLGDGDSHGRNVMTDGYDIKLIDHGSAFGDDRFNPAQDENIFIPYIMRIGRIEEGMTQEQKLEVMPKIDNFNVKDSLKSWILTIDSHKLAEKLNNLSIDANPITSRLKKLQNMVASGQDADSVINKAWVYGTES